MIERCNYRSFKNFLENNNCMDTDYNKEKCEANYLRLTIHDNDFWCTVRFVAELLNNMMAYCDMKITKEDLPEIKEYINSLLYATCSFEHYALNREIPSYDYFDPDLKIVNYLDIPEWENFECAYIPLFHGEVLYR